MKYIKEFNTHNAYEAFIVGADFVTPNISSCIDQAHYHFHPYVPPKAKLLDILYSDVNGNLSFTSELLPVSKGKTPIGLCIAGEEFFGTNEPARWMSLKYMNYTTPETGSLTAQSIYWGNYGTDINTIANIQTTYNDGSNFGYLTVDWITETNSNQIPALFTEDNEWNISVLGTVNTYAVTDIDGKNKTNKILATATAQATWMTDTTITNNSGANYTPAACCCARYHTIGTQAGDWYLGACGEISIIIVKRNEINTKLAAINTIYPNDCVSSLANGGYWTSTECNDNNVYYVGTGYGYVGYSEKRNNLYKAVAMLTF